MTRGAVLSARPALASWWRRRSRRERALLAAMAVALAAWLLALGVAQPLLAARAGALAAIARHEAALARLEALPEGGPAPAASDGRPVAAILTGSAPDYDLTIRRIEAEGDGARLEIDDAGFAEIVLWIDELERDHGLRAVAVEMDRRPEPGVVSARLTVRR
jgi:type II secretory pathway component PulM